MAYGGHYAYVSEHGSRRVCVLRMDAESGTREGSSGDGGASHLLMESLKWLTGMAIERPELRDRVIAQGVEHSAGSTPEAFPAFIKAEIERWRRIATASGVRTN